MKILFILPEYVPAGGGIATFYDNYINALSANVDSIKVVVGSAFTIGENGQVKGNVSIEYLKQNLFEKYHELFTKFEIFPELRKHFASAWAMYEQAGYGKGFDIVETTDWGLNYIPWAISESEIPLATTLHGSIGQIDYFDPVIGQALQSDLIRMIEVNTLKYVDELHTHSKSNLSFWNGSLDNTIKYIPPAFSLDEFKETKNEFNGKPLVVGRIQYWKGPSILCEALEKLGDKAPEINWIGRDTNYLENKISMSSYLEEKYSNVWKNKVNKPGILPYEKVLEYQRNSRYGIVPSTWDMFNFTCIEFMASGKPVICSEGAGASGLIENGVNGFTYSDNDPEKLAELILKLEGMDQSEIKKIGDNARETISKELDPNTIVRKKIDRYKYLISKGKENKKVNDWIIRFLSPEYGQDGFDSLLDNLPLKKLAGYGIKRTINKFKNNE